MIKKLTYFFMVPMALILLITAGFSLFKTTWFEQNMQIELPLYQKDHPLLLVAALAVCFAISYGLNAYLKQKSCNSSKMIFLASIYGMLISLGTVLFFRCVVTADSQALSDIAVSFMQGDYEVFGVGGYLHHYPFQLGMAALLEVTYRLFGVENFLAFQIMNVLAVTGIVWFLNKICFELYERETTVFFSCLLSLGLLPLYLYAVLVYGDVISMSFGVAAIYFGIRYIKTDRWQYIPLTGILIMLGNIVKSNTNVLLVAFLIMLLLKMIQDKRLSLILWVAGLLVLSQAGVKTVNAIYENRAGIDKMLDGTPKAAWIAMGLQGNDEESGGYGWYNGYNWNIYEECEYDPDVTQKVCLENIKESMKGFVEDPMHGIYFFYKKYVSQWNDPTFLSLILIEWYSRHSVDQPKAAEFFIYEAGRELLFQVMNFYHLLLCLLAAAGSLIFLRNWKLERAYLLLNVFGGFLFHMIWEANARYILIYFVLLVPVAAAAFSGEGLKIAEMKGVRALWNRRNKIKESR